MLYKFYCFENIYVRLAQGAEAAGANFMKQIDPVNVQGIRTGQLEGSFPGSKAGGIPTPVTGTTECHQLLSM